MSVSNSGSNNSYDDEAIAQLINRVDELEAIVDEQADTIDELESTVDEQQATINEQADTIDELRQQLSKHQEHDGKRTAELNQRVAAVEDEVDEIADNNGGGSGSSDDNPKGQDEETTALERICALPEHVVEDNLTRNQQRARSVAQLVKEIGKSVPAGIAITSSRIRRALSAREDTTIHRQTVKRVADFLKRFGDGGVKIKETRGGKTTVVFDEELADDVTGVVMDEGRGGVTPLVV